ncbi:MAG: flagellar basal body P-ring formation protein FlgA [Burkholderiales bacterium]|nr:flagellar basal body P-ring formation protein FlgA [Burkholderiales bacterium]MCC7116670.1 flagellar basal body P-ring formation protein FlgA [Burkholderiales bacterium]
MTMGRGIRIATTFVAAGIALAVSAGAPTEAVPAPVSAVSAGGAGDLPDRIRFLLERERAGGLDVDVEIGSLDPALKLAPCARAEPFLPPNARLWGKGSVGVRCVDGARWTAWVPVHVRVWGESPVAGRDLARGKPVTADDIRVERIELTRLPAGQLTTPEHVLGRLPIRSIAAGEPLRADLLRAPPVVQAGDPVRIVLVGEGFTISTEGKALTAAADGQSVSVAPAGTTGRAVAGVARPGGLVEIRPADPSSLAARSR